MNSTKSIYTLDSAKSMLLMVLITSTAAPSVSPHGRVTATVVVMSNLAIPLRTACTGQYRGFLGHVGIPLRNREGSPSIGHWLLN